jgi:DnaK suppressor protein
MPPQSDPTTPKPVEPRWQRLYEQLLRTRDEMSDAVQDYQSKALDETPDPLQDGLADSATENFLQEQLLGAVSLDQDILADVNLAISKIENGTYGICELTGEPIPIERLEALPWVRFTVEAQRQREAAGEAPKGVVGTNTTLPMTTSVESSGEM